EWRYYPEGLIVRSAEHVARMDFMRIDFYDDIAPRWPNGAHDQYRRDTLRDQWTKPGDSAARRHFQAIANQRHASSAITTSSSCPATLTGADRWPIGVIWRRMYRVDLGGQSGGLFEHRGYMN
uniref:hypothetical protein n=1 Tax=Burkholderia sp. BCC1974 TaxID=2817439 RepID=UPI002ABE9508